MPGTVRVLRPLGLRVDFALLTEGYLVVEGTPPAGTESAHGFRQPSTASGNFQCLEPDSPAGRFARRFPSGWKSWQSFQQSRGSRPALLSPGCLPLSPDLG